VPFTSEAEFETDEACAQVRVPSATVSIQRNGSAVEMKIKTNNGDVQIVVAVSGSQMMALTLEMHKCAMECLAYAATNKR